MQDNTKEQLEKIKEILEIDNLEYSSYASAISRLSSDSLTVRRQLIQLDVIENEHLASLAIEDALLKKWSAEPSEGESTYVLERRREALLKQSRECQRELDELMKEMPGAPKVSITDLVSQYETNQVLERELKVKQSKLRAFRGLPADIDLARLELRRARDEQTRLIELRERLLAQMADSVR